MIYDSNKYCSGECQQVNSPVGICDHCKHYDFNGDDVEAYIGDGYCNLHKEESEPHNGCEDFICFRVKGEMQYESS